MMPQADLVADVRMLREQIEVDRRLNERQWDAVERSMGNVLDDQDRRAERAASRWLRTSSVVIALQFVVGVAGAAWVCLGGPVGMLGSHQALAFGVLVVSSTLIAGAVLSARAASTFVALHRTQLSAQRARRGRDERPLSETPGSRSARRR